MLTQRIVSQMLLANTNKRNSYNGKSSTTSSARIKAEADRAALLTREAALTEKHALEEQLEQLESEALLSASTAKLAVMKTSDIQGGSKASNAKNSYVEQEKRKTAATLSTLSPTAKEYKPAVREKQNEDWSLPIIEPSTGVTLPHFSTCVNEQRETEVQYAHQRYQVVST